MTAVDFGFFVSSLEGKREGRAYRCRCPVHGGRSLMVTEKQGRPVWHCMAGCSPRSVIAELVEMGLWEQKGERHGPPSGYALHEARLDVVKAVFARNLDKAAGAQPRPWPSNAMADAAAILRRSEDRDDWLLAKIARGE